MRGRKITSMMLMCALLLTVFLFFQEEAQATVDFIRIVDTPGIGTTEIPDQSIKAYENVVGYAASFNTSQGYLGDVVVDWTVINSGTNATTTPPNGENSTFNSGPTAGTATWIADDGFGHSDTVVFTVNQSVPGIDYIQIRDATNGGGKDLGDPANYPTYPQGHMDLLFGAAYNFSSGYIGNVPTSSIWITSNGSIATVTSPGWYTSITCSPVNEGSAIITINDGLGHSNTTTVTVVAAIIDYITVLDSPKNNGSYVSLEYYDIGGTDSFWAAGYNITLGYVDDVPVNWSSSNPLVGNVSTPGVSTTFDALDYGVCYVTADFGMGRTNTTGPLIVISVDYIIIRDSTNGGGLEVGMDFIYNWGSATRGYVAAGYNNTYGYYKDVDVSWESSNTTVGTVTPFGYFTTFTAGNDGACVISANHSGIIDETGLITVSSYDADFMNIRSEPFGGGIVIDNASYERGATDIYYGALYSYAVGYLADTPYNVQWYSYDTSMVTVTSPGNFTTITCNLTNFGSTIIRFDYLNLTNTTGVNVLEWAIDYIRINDAPGAAGNPIGDRTYSVEDTDTYYATGHNNTHGYVMDAQVSWSIDDPTVGSVTTSGFFTTFTAKRVPSDSTCQVTATYNILSNTTGVLMVLAPTPDYVQIRDAPFGGGAVISSISYHKGDTDTYYGSSYNNTVGYLDSVSQSSIWVSSDDTIVDVSSPGNFSDITCNLTNSGTATVTLDDGGISNSTSVTVLEWNVDYILIRDAPSGGGSDLTDPANYKSFPVGHNTAFYGALYNISEGYIGDVSSTASWTSGDPGIVEVTSPGISSLISCNNKNYGIVEITLEEWTGHNATTEVTVLEPTIDFIKIVDAPGGAGDVVGDMEFEIGGSDGFYAAAFNFTANYLMDVSVDWSSNNTAVGKVTTPGVETNFSAVGKGVCKVTADNGGGISNVTGTLTVLIPLNLTVDDSGGAMFESIQKAIDYAREGANIFVYSGTYNENLTIDKSLTLKGENMGSTFIDGNGGNKVINVLADNVTIEEFTVEDGIYNIYVNETDSTIIMYNIIKDYDYGIYCYKTEDAYIAYNRITMGEYGIVTFEAYNDAIRWNNISYNTKYGAKDYNSQLKNCFNWNHFHHNYIAYYYDPDVPLSTLEFDENILEDNDIAIKVENASTISITNNTMNRNTYGIVLSAASPDIVMNIILDADYGIFSENSSPLISQNFMAEIAQYAIFAKFASALKIINNTASGSEIMIVDSNIEKLWLKDTTVTRINTTVENTHLDDTSNVEIKWNLRFRILDSEGNPIKNAVVLIYDVLDNLVSASVTDSQGWIENIDVFDTLQSKSGTINYNPYKIVVISDSKEETFSLEITDDTIMDVSFEGKGTTVAPSSPSFWWAFIIVIGFIGAIGLSGLFVEVMKYGILVFFLPLYTRLRKDKLLDQPTRERIYGYIIGNPGAYFGLIKQELELGNGQLTYHLKQLEDAHLVYSREDGPKKRFYPSNIPRTTEGKYHISSLQDKILGVINKNSGIGQKKLASTMGISRQVAGYHLSKMERQGLIDKEVEGRETKYYPSKT